MAVDADVEALLHFDGSHGSTSFVDDGAYGATTTFSGVGGDPKLTTAVKKFGSAALAFTAGITPLTVVNASRPTRTASNDFMLSLQVLVTRSAEPEYDYATICSALHENGSVVVEFYGNYSDFIDRLRVKVNSAPSFPQVEYAVSLSESVHQEIRATRSGDTLSLTLDGSVVATLDLTGVTTNFKTKRTGSDTVLIIGGLLDGGVNINVDEAMLASRAYLSPSAAAMTGPYSATDDTVTSYVALDSPLGAVALEAETRQAARLALSSPLGAPALLGFHDISSNVAELSPTRWVMDLITPAGPVRAPISSWQATLQTGVAQYLNCVIPSPGAFVDDITDATAFRIYGLVRLTNGNVIEYQFAEAPLQTVALAQGATNYSATISGYTDAAAAVTWPPESARTLRGVRTVYTSSQVRVVCAIDWSLRPGQTAYLNEVPLVVGYINYSVSDGDQFMTVGELTEAG